jgi:hypothetical protein
MALYLGSTKISFPVGPVDKEAVKVAVDEYLQENPPSGEVDLEALKQAIIDYLLENPVSINETDPTVPDWAKQPTKPSYTAEEVGALPADSDIIGPQGPKGEKGEPGVYILAEGETLENAPEDVAVVIDPYGPVDCTVEDIVAATLAAIPNAAEVAY